MAARAVRSGADLWADLIIVIATALVVLMDASRPGKQGGRGRGCLHCKARLFGYSGRLMLAP